MYMCIYILSGELTYSFTGGSYLEVGIWKPKIMYYLHTSILVSPCPQGGTFLISMTLRIIFSYIRFISNGIAIRLPCLFLPIMVFIFHVFFLNIQKVGLDDSILMNEEK